MIGRFSLKSGDFQKNGSFEGNDRSLQSAWLRDSSRNSGANGVYMGLTPSHHPPYKLRSHRGIESRSDFSGLYGVRAHDLYLERKKAGELAPPGSKQKSCNPMLPQLFRVEKVGDYIYASSPVSEPDADVVYLPLEVDTEFAHVPGNSNPHQTTLTVQYRALNEKVGKIFAHPDIADIARHPVLQHEVSFVDYLWSMGFPCYTLRNAKPDSSRSWLQVDLFAFYAVAEVSRIFTGEYLDDIISMMLKADNRTGICQDRRLRTYTRHGGYESYVVPNWTLVSVNTGKRYNLRLSIIDTSALLGFITYKTLCELSGVKNPYKDNFTSEEKSRMHEMYVERPEDFDNYALGDLHNHDALMGNYGRWETLYRSLGLSHHFTPPRLTIGATVARLMEARTNELFGHQGDRTYINAFCKWGTSEWLKHDVRRTGCLNAKVDGGRCRNNRPTDIVVKDGILCDIDIAGCYGRGLEKQVLPIGIPVVFDYPIESDINNYLTLRDFLAKYRHQLQPGLWFARVSTPDGYRLKYEQGFLVSWFPPKNISQMITDTDEETTDEWWTVDNVGYTKILTRQVHYAVITEEFLDWLEYVASVRQRKEMLDNLQVVTAIYYPADDRLDEVDEFLSTHNNHTGRNTCEIKKVDGKTTKVNVEQECHKWFGETLGDLLVKQLLDERNKYSKSDLQQKPLNTLYKLAINTIYGDMVSPFFKISNVVVGNNITARARAMAWYMEKALHGFQTITDGCTFELTRVVTAQKSRMMNGANIVSLYANKKCSNHQFINLGNRQHILVDDDGQPALEGMSHKESYDWIANEAMTHIKAVFPNLTAHFEKNVGEAANNLFRTYQFEVKSLYDTGVFHASANYLLGYKGEYTVKMRGYSKKNTPAIDIVDDHICKTDEDYIPSQIFLKSILKNPEAVERGIPYQKSKVLKVKDFKRHYEKRYKESQIYPGWTVNSVSMIREFSLSQFTYQDEEQFKAWEREHTAFRNYYEQSYEMFFLNEDGTVNFVEMVLTIDQKIREGWHGFFQKGEKRKTHSYRRYEYHPHADKYQTLRAMIQALPQTDTV